VRQDKSLEVGRLAILEQEVGAESVRRILAGTKGVVRAGVLAGGESGKADQHILVAVHRDARERIESLPLGIFDAAELDGGAVGSQLPPLHRAMSGQGRGEEYGV